jgi:hypothetical protein
MKICWDNLEKMTYSKRTGKWYIGNNTYTYEEKCSACGEPYLKASSSRKTTCSPECRMRGKHHSEETKKKIGEANRNNYSNPENHPFYGRKHSEESIEKMRKAKQGKKLTDEHKKKISEKMKGENNHFYGKHHTEETKQKIGEINSGENNGFWKGGSWRDDFPSYDNYAPQLEWCEEVRRNEDNPYMLEVRCTHCNKWFVPKPSDVHNRIYYIDSGGSRFYCSESCKQACPIYHKSAQTLMKEDAVRAGRLSWLKMDREVQHELRQMVLERDGHKCTKCGATDKPLHCHHILPVAVEPLLSADVDNCITLCIDCHKEAHQKDGCRIGQLRIDTC